MKAFLALLRGVAAHTWRSIAWGVVLLAFLQGAEYEGWLDGFEGRILDIFVRISDSGERRSVPVLIVEVDDPSYESCFGARSPMAVEYLEPVVSGLIGAVPENKSLFMGIDILTDAKLDYEKLRQLAINSEGHVTIVWAAAAEATNVIVPGFRDWLWGEEELSIVQSSKVLGLDPVGSGNNGVLNTPHGRLHWAMAVYPKDKDLRVRRFARDVRLAYPDGTDRSEHTWPRQIAESYQPGKRQFDDSEHEAIVSYNVDFHPDGDSRPGVYKVDELFVCKAQGGDKIGITPHGPRMREFMDRIKSAPRTPIVLVGGTFEFGRDTYRTSLGSVPGLYVNAYALAAELEEAKGIGLREISHKYLVLMDIAVLAGFVWVFESGTTIRWKIRLSALFVIAAFLLSYSFFLMSYLWVSCVGIAVGFFPHVAQEVYIKAGEEERERAREARKKEEQERAEEETGDMYE